MSNSAPTDDQLRQAMASAMASFAAAVASIGADQWHDPTPCDGWSVFDVVDHVVAGERFTEAILGGATLDDAIAATVGIERNDQEIDAQDIAAQLTAAAADALAAFDGSLDRTIDHRVGTITARRNLGFRIIDQLGHTWDLATAIGRPVELDADALAVGVAIARAERETLEQSANFATTPEDRAESDDPLTEFLVTIGRTPS